MPYTEYKINEETSWIKNSVEVPVSYKMYFLKCQCDIVVLELGLQY